MIRIRQRRWRMLAIPAVLLLLTSTLVLSQRGITVIIENADDREIHSVVVQVTGNSYPLGDIAPGRSNKATVNATGESKLGIDFTDADGHSRRLKAESYFEPRYRGSIRVAIKGGAIDHIEKKIFAQ